MSTPNTKGRAGQQSRSEDQVEIEEQELLGVQPRPPEENISSQLVKPDGFLVFCAILGLITATSAILCALVNVVSVTRSFSTGQNVFVGILRCYGVVIAIFVAMAETEWEWIFKLWSVLESWIGRGMLQCFVAVLTEAMAKSSGESGFESTFHAVVSWMLLGCGAFYTIAGLLCMGRVKKRRVQKFYQRELALKELEELERKKRELQGLLATS